MNSAWHSPEKGSLGSRGQTNFICPLGVFCCTWMTTKDTIHLYSPPFLIIQGSEEVKPITECRCVMDSTCPFSFANHHTDMQPGTAAGHQAACHATKDAFCTARPREGKRLWLCGSLGDGKGPKVQQWSPSSADSQNEHGPWHHRPPPALPPFENERCETLLKDS